MTHEEPEGDGGRDKAICTSESRYGSAVLPGQQWPASPAVTTKRFYEVEVNRLGELWLAWLFMLTAYCVRQCVSLSLDSPKLLSLAVAVRDIPGEFR